MRLLFTIFDLRFTIWMLARLRGEAERKRSGIFYIVHRPSSIVHDSVLRTQSTIYAG